jgi:hypothetical protein
MGRYWWRVAGRAFRDARAAIGHNVTKSVLGYIGTGLAFGIFGFWEGGNQAWAKVEWWIAAILGGYIIFIGILVWQFLAAPRKLEQEALAQAKKEAEELRSRRDELEAEISQARKSCEAELQARAAREAELQAEIQKARNCDPRRNAIRFTVEGFLARFERLESRLAAGEQSIASDISWLEQEAQLYVEEHLPECRRLFERRPFGPSISKGFVTPGEEIGGWFKSRIKTMREILEFLG